MFNVNMQFEVNFAIARYNWSALVHRILSAHLTLHPSRNWVNLSRKSALLCPDYTIRILFVDKFRFTSMPCPEAFILSPSFTDGKVVFIRSRTTQIVHEDDLGFPEEISSIRFTSPLYFGWFLHIMTVKLASFMPSKIGQMKMGLVSSIEDEKIVFWVLWCVYIL